MMRILWLVFFLISFSASSQAGPGDSGGGDDVSLDFEASLHTSLEFMRVSSRPEFAEMLRFDWAEMIKGMKVITVDRKLYVTVNGMKQECVALNHPSTRMIEVNRARWKALQNPRFKEGMALHEVLSLAGLEATGRYSYSAIYLSAFGYAAEPILGPVDEGPAKIVPLPKSIAKIYPYRCRRRFVEGEGVTSSAANCIAGQHLGFISAEYTFYIFSGLEKNNFSSKFHESLYENDICGIRNVTRISCDNLTEAEFGLAEKPENAFVIGLYLYTAPAAYGGSESGSVYGYAALPDSQGRCPANLVEARPYMAQPQSQLQPLPSSFNNTSNSLNNMVIGTSNRAPRNFEVWRQPSVIPCDAAGSCSWPEGGSVLAQSVRYMPLSPRICVIPSTSLP
jgi:hypothetical protein